MVNPETRSSGTQALEAADSRREADHPAESRLEFLMATVLLAASVLYAMWRIVEAPSSSFPVTTDGMGHLAKVKYIADCFSDLRWPSWFPYWYSGSTVMQYYPPLSYLLLAPVQMCFDNIMITFKFFVFFTQFFGALGVWYFCRRYIGPWVGLAAGLVYSWQPFLLRSLLLSGVVSQGPVFALSPWVLALSCELILRGSKRSWLWVCLSMALLILSHAMHAVLVAVCCGAVVLFLAVQVKAPAGRLFAWGLAVVTALLLVTFWWLPGVTQLENPGIPYLLPEAAKHYDASLDWFLPSSRYTTWFYFSAATVVLGLTTFFLRPPGPYRIATPLLIGFAGSLALSFGSRLGLSHLLPMGESIVFGRVLSFSAVLGSVLIASCCESIFNALKRVPRLPIMLVFLILVMLDSNPAVMPLSTDPFVELSEQLDTVTQNIGSQGGRFGWVAPANSEISCLPMLRGFRMTDGWNIEGTPHNRSIWQHNTAIATGNDTYVARNLLQWNVTSVVTDYRYDGLKTVLYGLGFENMGTGKPGTLMIDRRPSSYVMKYERNAVAIGTGAKAFVMNFPWFIEGRSPYLEDYRVEEFDVFTLVYLVDPKVRSPFAFERSLTQVARRGSTVIMEPGRSEQYPFLGVFPYTERVYSNQRLVPTVESPWQMSSMLSDLSGAGPAFEDLDGVYWRVDNQNPGSGVIGYKNVDGERVYLVGLALGQMLRPQSPPEIRQILDSVMSVASPHKSIRPTPFPISGLTWHHDGISFTYRSEAENRVWLSLTYTPRWFVTIDGQQVPTRNIENLVFLRLPAGEHNVRVKYGMTWVGWLGIAISCLTALAVCLILRGSKLVARLSRHLVTT